MITVIFYEPIFFLITLINNIFAFRSSYFTQIVCCFRKGVDLILDCV